MSSVSEFNTAIDECVAAQNSGDYSLAIKKLTIARTILPKITDQDMEGRDIEYDRDFLNDLAVQLKDLKGENAFTAPGSRAIRTSTRFFGRSR